MKNAKPVVLCIIAFWLTLVSQLSHARHAAILIDSSNGNVLYELEANQLWYPASLTKLMTLYMTFEALESGTLRLNEQLNVSGHAARQPTSKLGLRTWDTISTEDAIIAIITRSANDAAVVLGEAIGGTEQNFAVKMTSTAHRLGMYGSHFMNATGLPHDWQTTTAHDMGMLAMRLIRDFPQYYGYFGTDSLYYNGRVFHGINKFVSHYPGAEGMKTGYTCGSGYNLVATANQYGKRLIGVVLGGMTSTERYEHMFMMMDMGFSNPYSYRSKNINTMRKEGIGVPPYQLSCGHRPTSHYTARPREEDDGDDHQIHYVKKYSREPFTSAKKPIIKPINVDKDKLIGHSKSVPSRALTKSSQKDSPLHIAKLEKKSVHPGKAGHHHAEALASAKHHDNASASGKEKHSKSAKTTKKSKITGQAVKAKSESKAHSASKAPTKSKSGKKK